MNTQDISKINGLFKQIDELNSSLEAKDRMIQQLEHTIQAMTDRLMTEQDLRHVVDQLTPRTKARGTKK